MPPLKARVTDLAGTLNAQQAAALEHTLAEFEHRKGAQVAVLLVPTTQPETVEQYAVRVEESWKLGRKGVNDGVLLLVAKNDRKLRIEVGYGLEGVLPDAIAKRIIEEDITPRFKQGDFYGGIRAGSDRIMRVIEGEKLPPAPISSVQFDAGRLPLLIFAWFVGMFAYVILSTSLKPAALGRAAGSGVLGIAMAVAAGMVFSSLLLGLAVGIMLFVILLFIPWSWGESRTVSSRAWDRTDWAPSGGGSSSSWSSSSDSGGFSGGGGSSGGGGASGSW